MVVSVEVTVAVYSTPIQKLRTSRALLVGRSVQRELRSACTCVPPQLSPSHQPPLTFFDATRVFSRLDATRGFLLGARTEPPALTEAEPFPAARIHATPQPCSGCACRHHAVQRASAADLVRDEAAAGAVYLALNDDVMFVQSEDGHADDRCAVSL